MRRNAFARANKIDRIVLDAPKARLGIVTTGKSYLDVLQALEYLGIERARCAGDRHPRVQDRHDLAAGAGRHPRSSPRASKTSSWSRKSAPSSSRR
jgi:hypothetical protein